MASSLIREIYLCSLFAAKSRFLKVRECYFALLILSKWEFREEYVHTIKCLLQFEHQIHQNIIYTSDKLYSIHINKNCSLGLKNVFTVWCRNNRRRSPCNKALTFATVPSPRGALVGLAPKQSTEPPQIEISNTINQWSINQIFNVKPHCNNAKPTYGRLSGDGSGSWSHQCWLCCVPGDISLLHKLRWCAL